MAKSEILRQGEKNVVYDISLDGTFIDAFTLLTLHNTDGFNFQLPPEETYRYTKEHPYIGKGSNREVKLGKEYVGFEADVAEFNDMYMNKVYASNAVQKMGLGIDEIVAATINFSRKNYADYFPGKPEPKDVKLVGNTIKSKKMPEYIAKFLAVGIRLLLNNKGQEFIDEYYNYIDKIYNYGIPLRDIATKGKIKKSVEEYLEDVKTLTKAGRPKSRQAWYELAIRNNIKVDNGDTIYYINTGKSKSHSDVKKITRYFEDRAIGGLFDNEKERTEITKEIEREYKIYRKKLKDEGKPTDTDKDEFIAERYPNCEKEIEIVLNCVMLPNDMIESDEETFCTDDMEYNTAKYIDMFNKRITPLLVCFSRDIREQILVSNPNDRQYFTREQCRLVSGEPNKPEDQDTYEQLMTMEDKEIQFWKSNGMVPPFLEECGMGSWEDIVSEYDRRMEREKALGVDKIRTAYNTALSNLTREEIEKFIDEGELPQTILKLVEVDPVTCRLVSREYNDIAIGDIHDITDMLGWLDTESIDYVETEE